jgi:uncharacterized damage-inducible protein DinB
MFEKLFKYNYDANEGFIKSILENKTQLPEKALLLFSHVLNAHTIWLDRINPGMMSASAVWELHSPETYSQLNATCYEATLPLLQGDLNRQIFYTNTKGQAFSNTVAEILYHVINHGTHHRAQICTLLKEAGLEVPLSDYIFFARQSQ